MTDNTSRIAFIGGGNMASAILGGLIQRGLAPSQVLAAVQSQPGATPCGARLKSFGRKSTASGRR